MISHNVVDSSGWLEYFADTDRAAFFAHTERLIVPVLCIHEVFKKVLRERGEDSAMQVASMMQIGTVVDLDCTLAMEAARYPLPLADRIIYSTAARARALLWT